MFRARENGETFVSATMCPQQCVRNNVSSFARALNLRVVFSTLAGVKYKFNVNYHLLLWRVKLDPGLRCFFINPG